MIEYKKKEAKVKIKILFLCLVIFGLIFILFSPTLSQVSKAEVKESGTSGKVIPKLTSEETKDAPSLRDAKVYPFWGPVCQRYTYSVFYSDQKNREPEYVKIYFNGQMIDLEKENPADNNYQQGVKYIYKYVPKKLGSNFYYFEASNGVGKARDGIIDSPDNGPVLFESDFSQNEIALIDPESGQKKWSYPTQKEWVKGIALSDDGKYLAAATTRHIYFFDTSSSNPKWIYEYSGNFDVQDGDVKGGIDISADGAKIFALIGQEAILFSNNSEKPIWKKDIKQQGYNAAISADGKYMAVGTAGSEENQDTNLLILWNEKNPEPLWQYHASGNFHDVSLSSDGSYIAGATGCPDRRAYIFSRDSKEPIMKTEMLTYDSPVNRAKISADGQFAAYSAEYDKGIVFAFKNPAFGGSNQPLWQILPPNNRSGRAMAMTPDGKFILETTFAGDVLILGPDSNKPLENAKLDKPLAAAGISNDGNLIAVGGSAKKVYLFNHNLGTPKSEIDFGEYISEIDISANGKFVGAGTGGANYFFESFNQDENKEFSCDKIIEPDPENTAKSDNNLSNNNNTNNKQLKLPVIIFGAIFLAIIIFLIIYLVICKKHNKSINKKIVLFLAIVAIMSLILTLYFVFGKDTNKNDKIEKKENNTPTEFSTSTESNSNQNQNNSSQTNSTAISSESKNSQCGNSLCEPNAGETKENCPKDCSGEINR